MAIDPSQIFMNERLRLESCVYCGGNPETREHIPPKIFLDLPYPKSLPVVPACNRCNNAKSADEEYLACLLECIVSGTTDIAQLEREKIKKSLLHSQRLQSKIANAKRDMPEGIIWDVDHERVNSLAVKLAQGHIAYEEVAMWDAPVDIYINPLCTAPPAEKDIFSYEGGLGGIAPWPEIGSRAFLRLFAEDSGFVHSWIELQKGCYRYKIIDSLAVAIVIREYLGIYVAWE